MTKGSESSTHVLDLLDREVGIGRNAGVPSPACWTNVDDDHDLYRNSVSNSIRNLR